jgi:hypothetical protein
MLQAILQAMLQGAGPVGYCPKVLKGVLLTGSFGTRSLFLGVLLTGRSAYGALCSWFLVPGVLVVGVTGTGSPGSPRQSQ